MISNPTTFVLGAGASIDYGYPSGKALKDKMIIDIKNQKSREYQLLRELNFDDYYIQQFILSLEKSGQKSVDAFLENRLELVDLGKAAIAIQIIQCEQAQKLHYAENNWYEYIYNKMNSPFEEFDNNHISFITYNYDRSLEQFLFLSLKNSYGKSDPEVAEKIGQIPIFHVHGIVGNLDWQTNKGWPYSPDRHIDRVKQVMLMINIISEIQDEKDHFSKAWKILNNSERIIFLGFGYHKENIERLKLNELAEGKSFHGSAFGFTENEKGSIKEYFGSKRKIISLGNNKWDALRYLREAITNT